ncbi:MAG TPA: hypothetical protein VGF55_10430, partial [Gemmataceae bacterium]
VKETAADPDADNVSFASHDAPEPIDPASDKDLLKQVLADEPPPSDIILKDPSQEHPALPAEAAPKAAAAPKQDFHPKTDPESVLGGSFDDVPLADPASATSRSRGSGSGPFELPPELAATRPGDSGSSLIPRVVPAGPGDSSVLGHNPPSGEGQSGMASDLWAPSSQVDLVGQAAGGSSESMQNTDEVAGPPPIPASIGDSSQALLGDDISGGPESSSVDLGSEAEAELPYPLGMDSGGGLSSVRPGRRQPPAEADSGTVDLLRSSSEEFDLGLTEPTTSPSWAAAREDLPPTVPLVPAGRGRLIGWAGGGAAGLAAGVALCAGLWYAGAIPDKSIGSPIENKPVNDQALIALRGRAEDAEKRADQFQAQRDDLTKKNAAAAKQAQTARADLDKLNGQLKRAGLNAAALADVSKRLAAADAAAAEAKQARERADALAEQVKRAEANQATANGSAEKLKAAQAAQAKAEARAKAADTELARAREQLAKSGSDAQTAKDAATRAEAGRKQSAAAVAAIAQRLGTSATSTTDLLAALDRALARPAGETGTTTTAAASPPPSRPPIVPTEPVRTPQQAAAAAFAGHDALRSNDAAGAEREFGRLAASADANAVHFYFLGLAQYRQGRWADAAESFRRGWALERDSHPSPREVEAAFENLSVNDRHLINQYRQ